MTSNRSEFRNVHFYDGSNPEDALGGLIQNGSVTEGNFLDMLGMLLITQTPIIVQHRVSGHIVLMSESRLEVGSYDVYCESNILVSSEPWIHRIISHNVSGREKSFCNRIRARDGRCVISGVVNRRAPHRWTMFEAAHIFPLVKENIWIHDNYEQYITDIDDTTGVSKINSIQNGFLLQSNIHQLFDQYLISVNPDDGYKVVVFDDDLLGLDGRTLDRVCRNELDPHRVSDNLLRWHFKQCVLANMRGMGEPIFEHDFVGKDMVQEISSGPYGKERFEMEVSARLYGVC